MFNLVFPFWSVLGVLGATSDGRMSSLLDAVAYKSYPLLQCRRMRSCQYLPLLIIPRRGR